MNPSSTASNSAASRSRGQALVEFALIAPILFLMLIAIIEAGVFVMNMETLNNATREGARFAIVSGAKSSCPQGPMPGGVPNPCDPEEDGDRIRAAVRDAAVGLVSIGDLTVPTPLWTVGGSPSESLPIAPGQTQTDPGTNARGEYVTVFADYSYKPIIKQVLGTELIPSITLSSRSTLVVNN